MNSMTAYRKKDLPRLRKLSEDKNLGQSVRNFYKRIVKELENEGGTVDTREVEHDA